MELQRMENTQTSGGTVLHKVGIITVQRRLVILARPCKIHEGRELSAGLEYDFLQWVTLPVILPLHFIQLLLQHCFQRQLYLEHVGKILNIYRNIANNRIISKAPNQTMQKIWRMTQQPTDWGRSVYIHTNTKESRLNRVFKL